MSPGLVSQVIELHPQPTLPLSVRVEVAVAL